ncbi:hypothetical protein ACHAXR_003262 [Thalassiosira sp. AJA248-18]
MKLLSRVLPSYNTAIVIYVGSYPAVHMLHGSRFTNATLHGDNNNPFLSFAPHRMEVDTFAVNAVAS